MITLTEIRDKKPCEDSWTKLLKSYGKTKADNTVVTCQHLLKTLNIEDTMWVISNCIDGKRVKKRHMVADIAERVLHIWEDWAKDNAPDHLDTPRKAVEAVRNGKVNEETSRAVYDAAEAADDYLAACAAEAAAAAAVVTDADGAYAAADGALAAWSAYTASAAAAAERVEQEKIILKYFGE
mgnify:CR=1 FL=1